MTAIIIIILIICATVLGVCISSDYFSYKQQKLRIDEEKKIQERKILPKSDTPDLTKSEDIDWFREACKIIPRKN